MLRRSHLLVALLAAALLVPAAAAGADTPTKGALYHDGPSGRYLLGGTWQLRTTGAWSDITVPYAWNKGDDLQSYLGGVAYYRKQFTLPRAPRGRSWVVRFESVNFRSSVSINGHRLGTHVGAFLPFEFVIPSRYLHRGTNTLLVRTDSKTHALDVPYQRLSSRGVPNAGWWPYGGILREVYLREVDRVDLEDVQILPRLPNVSGPAQVLFRAKARNLSDHTVRAAITGRFGSQRVRLGSVVLGRGGSRQVSGSLTVRNPRLWSPTARSTTRRWTPPSAAGASSTTRCGPASASCASRAAARSSSTAICSTLAACRCTRTRPTRAPRSTTRTATASSTGSSRRAAR